MIFMTERLTYKNEDKFYLKWGVDQELDKLSPEVQEIVRGAIERLGKYEDLDEEKAVRTASAEWQTLMNERDYWNEIAGRYATTNSNLREYIFDLRKDFDIEAIIDLEDTGASYPLQILRGIRERLSKEKPKKPSKNWIFNRFGQR